VDRLLLACALTTVLGLGALGALAYGLEPRPQPFDRLERFAGQRVCVDAVLAHLRPVDAGAHLTLVEANRSLAAFARFTPAAATGDRVRACGDLDTASGTLWLRLGRPDDLHVIATYDEEATSLALLAERPWERVGRHVALRGVYEHEDGRSWLADPTSQAHVRLSSVEGVDHGSTVWVRGLVEYDEDASAFRLRVEEVTPA
jgi:hypothetical protein